MTSVHDIDAITAQPGPQTDFLECPANIAFYGGAAGGGKSYGLLLDTASMATRYRGFGAVIFRRTSKQVTAEGGLWQRSEEVYPLMGALPTRHNLRWRFEDMASAISFGHLEHDKTRFDWQGSELPYIGFDELTHFTENQFWYLVGRNRSMCGSPPLVRATLNPDPDHFAAKMVAWYIDPQTGYAIPKRSGAIRYFLRLGDEMHWGDTWDDLVARFGWGVAQWAKSFTFIASSIEDNPILLARDPGYLATLMSLPMVERERLRYGNWKIRVTAGTCFRRSWFRVVKAAPTDVVARVRFWDRAATEEAPGVNPDASAGVKVSKDRNNRYCVEHVERMFARAHSVNRAMANLADQDGPKCAVAYNQDPGSAGKGEAEATAATLAPHVVKFWTTTGDKVTRALPASAQAEAGNIDIVEGDWNDEFLTELENFPPPAGGHDDQVDGLSGAFEYISKSRRIFVA
jgi:predicted phage terminase large subunit-like protein